MKIAPVYQSNIKQQKKQFSKILEEEWQSMGEPRLTPDSMLDLQALAIQKQIFINKWGIEDDIH